MGDTTVANLTLFVDVVYTVSPKGGWYRSDFVRDSTARLVPLATM